MPRLSQILINTLRQDARPWWLATSATVGTQALTSYYLASGLASVDRTKEAVVAAVLGVVSTLFHACEENLYCPLLTYPEWQLLDVYCSMVLLTLCALALAGIEAPSNWGAAFAAICLAQAAACWYDGPSLRMQAAWWVVLGAGVRAAWARLGSVKGLNPVLLSSTAGLVVPGLFVLAISTYAGADASRRPRPERMGDEPAWVAGTVMTPRREEQDVLLPFYWIGHCFWHIVCAFCAFCTISARTAIWKRDPNRPRAAVEGNVKRKKPRNRRLMSLLMLAWQERAKSGDYGFVAAFKRRWYKQGVEGAGEIAADGAVPQQLPPVAEDRADVGGAGEVKKDK